MPIILPNQALVLNAYAVLVDETPGNVNLNDHIAFIEANGVSTYRSTLDGIFASVPTASLAANMLANLGLASVFTQAQAEAYLGGAENRVGAMLDLANALYYYSGSDSAILAAKVAYVDLVESSYDYSILPANESGAELDSFNGTTFMLTTGADSLSGTALDDIFYGFVQQNQNGANANAYSTGDVIDGGDGIDTITATLINDRIIEGDGQQLDINVRTTNVEIAKFEVLDEGVAVDAGNMDSVTQFWSVNSDDAGLVLEDVRLGSKLSVTKDITFGMKDVDYESDLTAMFDSASLRNAGTNESNSQILIEVGYEDAPTGVTNENPTKELYLKISFTHDGKSFDSGFLNTSKTNGAYPDTYQGLKDLLDATLDAQGFTNLAVTFGDDFTTITTDAGEKPLQVTAKQIYITDPAGKEFTAVTSSSGADSSDPTSDVASRVMPIDPSTATTLIESNLILDNAGRGSTAGDVVIGAMSNSDRGVEKFNVMVDRSSAIESLNSTNDFLKEIVITSLAGEGDLEIGSIDTTVVENSNVTNGGLNLIDASAFKGANLMLGTTVEAGNTDIENGGSVTAADVNNLKTLSANIAGDVTFYGSIDGNIKANFSYTTGSGDDVVRLSVDGDAVDSLNTGLAITTGGGADVVTVSGEGGVSDETTLELENLSISTGAGDDTINLNTDHIYWVNAGSDSDFVRVDADVSGTTGSWSIGDGTAATGLDWADRVLYQAKLTVDFAGFTQTVTIDTDASGYFIATQEDINNAVIAAIKANPELARLLTTSVGTGGTSNQQLFITSTVQGINDLTIQVVQPEVVATGATGSQVNFNGTHLAAIETGLVMTSVVADSSVITAVADVVTAMATIDGNLNETGSNADTDDFVLDSENGTDGTNNTSGSATSIKFIDMGTGANDLIALDSDDASTDTLVFSAAWGKVSVLNFFDAQYNDATQGAAVDTTTVIDHTDETVGDHILDFTAFLDDQTSASGSTLSAVRIATSLETDSAVGLDVASNMVTIINDFAVADTTETWAGLTATQLQNALNGVTIGATAGYGNITAAADAAVLPAALLGTTIDSIIMVENLDNVGEYKVFNAEVSDLGGDDVFAVTLLGVIDFGESIDTAVLANFA